MACTFLVFCVPSFPKAFTGEGITTKLISTLRSWIPFLRPFPADIDSGKRPQGVYTKSSYYKVDENGTALTHITYSEPVLSLGGSQGDTRQPRGILLTKNITTTEEYVNGNREEKAFPNQHPWIGRV